MSAVKIKEILEQLKRRAPKRDASGMLYKNRKQLIGKYRRISLWTILVSTENTHQVYECVIQKKEKPKTRQGWALWISKNAQGVFENGVLPGLGLRTAPKQWAVMRVIGWTPHDLVAGSRAKKSKKRKARKKK